MHSARSAVGPESSQGDRPPCPAKRTPCEIHREKQRGRKTTTRLRDVLMCVWGCVCGGDGVRVCVCVCACVCARVPACL